MHHIIVAYYFLSIVKDRAYFDEITNTITNNRTSIS